MGKGGVDLTNKFHFAVRLFIYRSQMTSKCGKNKGSGLLASALSADYFRQTPRNRTRSRAGSFLFRPVVDQQRFLLLHTPKW